VYYIYKMLLLASICKEKKKSLRRLTEKAIPNFQVPNKFLQKNVGF